ncbi:OsmC family protein [Microcoleus sp. FACHB-1515]|uniref:OsmC family protein n=1 Tax=Cyanophyceae TaxID=3028117 RepID=UPI00168408E8|nr:OsmC family protein [Microcoleus sp. FACHB-1515]MBD2093508.1 OsmC family protein [Microcoleus sp. FACHB-1515]
MSQHLATVQWQRNGATFTDHQYSREHVWQFDGGMEIAASASPQNVREPYANPACVDPEEAFVASLSSCHMLWFLAIAAKQKFVVERYLDRAIGILEKDEAGNLAITQVRLRPEILFAGDDQPTDQQVEAMHEAAHDRCFLANSVKTQILVEDLTSLQQ